MKKILVPTDGSERAGEAADYAIELAKALGAGLVFVSVVDEVPPAYAYELESGVSLDMEELDEQRRKYAQSAVDELKQKADNAGVESKAVVADGHPWERILELASEEAVDQIVIGSHGRRALAAAVLGNVTFNVIHGAQVPVTVIPRRD